MSNTIERNEADHRFADNAMKSPLLSRDHEQELARKWREMQDEDALHELTTAYIKLVIAIAAKFRHYGLPNSDLVQEGNLGLMLAAQKFDPARNVRFSTYAMWWVRAQMQDYVLRNWSIVRTSTSNSHKTLFFNLRRLRAQIGDRGEHSMSEENQKLVANQLGVSTRDVRYMSGRLQGADSSLNLKYAEDGGEEIQDLLADDGPTPEQIAMQNFDEEKQSAWLKEALHVLDEREALIISERRLSEDVATLGVLSERLSISRERVRQLEFRALKKLKEAFVKIAQAHDGPIFSPA